MSAQRLKIVLLLLLLPGLALWRRPRADTGPLSPPPFKVSRVSAFRGQPAHPPVLVADKTRVLVYFSKANPGYEGFVVFRAPGRQVVAKGNENAVLSLSGSFRQITDVPVFAAVTAGGQGALGRATLPQEWRDLEPAQLKKYWDDFLFLGMRADGVISHFPVMARIGGSLYVDTPPAPGQTYTYVVGVMNQRSEVEVFPPQTLVAKPSAVPPPLSVSEYADEREGGVMVAFPKNDAVLGYDVYRAFARTGPFAKQNTTLCTRKEFVQKNLINDKPYFYQVRMVDIAGNQSPPSPVVKVVPRDRTPPFPVRGVTARLAPDNKKAILTWQKNTAPDLKGYLVLRENVVWKAPPADAPDAPAPAPVAADAPLPTITPRPLPPDVLTYVDKTFQQGKRYNYYVVAVDKTGNRSLRSGLAHLNSPDKIPPLAPKNLGVKTRNREGITLGWQANKEDDLFGYRVFKGSNPNALVSYGPNVVRAPKTTFTDTFFHANQTYFYKLVALDESENRSGPSNVIKVKAPDTLSPSMPAGVSAKAGDSRVFLQWAPVKDKDLKGYRVLNALAEAGPFVPIGRDFGKKVTTHLHKPLKNGQKRWYVVSSVDYSGNVSEPTDAVMALPADAVPPAAPAAPVFSASEGVVLLTVKPNKEKDIAGYKLFRVAEIPTGVPEEVFPGQLFPPTQQEIRVEYQTPETPHWYFLVARDTSENESRDGAKAGPVVIKSKTPP